MGPAKILDFFLSFVNLWILHKQWLTSFQCAGLKQNKMFSWLVANLHCVVIFSLLVCVLILFPNKWIWNLSLTSGITHWQILRSMGTFTSDLLCGSLVKTFHFFLQLNEWSGISDCMGACPSGKHLLLIYRPQLMESKLFGKLGKFVSTFFLFFYLTCSITVPLIWKISNFLGIII